MRHIKMVTVGARGVGKSSQMVSFVNGEFPEDDIPPVLDELRHDVSVNGTTVQLSMWDTGNPEFPEARLRPLIYPGTDVFLLCFSIVSPESLENVKSRYSPEVSHHIPDGLKVLVGTKLDLRDDPVIIEKLANKGQEPVSYEQGWAMAAEIGAVRYCETSAKTGEGLEFCFAEAISAVLNPERGTLCDTPPPEMPDPPAPIEFSVGERKNITPDLFSDTKFISADNAEPAFASKFILSACFPFWKNFFVEGVSSPLLIIQNEESSIENWICTDDFETTYIPVYGSSCFIHNDVFYSLCGNDDHGRSVTEIFRFDIEECVEMSPLRLRGDESVTFPCSTFQSCSLVGEYAYIFGGKNSAGYYDRMFQFDITEEEFLLINTKGERPTKRYGQSQVTVGSSLYIFGGYDSNYGHSNEFFTFHTLKKSWKRLDHDNAPTPRIHHASCLIKRDHNKYLIVFGGKGDHTELNDLYVYNIRTAEWTKIESEISPSPRYGMSFVEIDGQSVLFGGQTTNEVLNDVWILNNSFEWTPHMSSAGERSFYGSAVYEDQLFIYGGKDESSLSQTGISKITKSQLQNNRNVESVFHKMENFDEYLREIYPFNKIHPIPTFEPFYEKLVENDFHESALQLQKENLFTNLTVILKDGKMKIHRIMLETNTSFEEILPYIEENGNNRFLLELQEMSIETFEMIKNLIYSTEKIDSIDEQNALRIIRELRDYNLERIIEIVCKTIYKNISDFDLFELYYFEEELGIPKLNEIIERQFKLKYTELHKTELFKELPKSFRKHLHHSYYPGELYKKQLETYMNIKAKKDCIIQ